MTTKSYTLLLLGLTALGASLTGCILATTDNSGPGPGTGNCLDNQYFVVQWLVDNGAGTTSLGCSQTPPSHVDVTFNTPPPNVMTIPALTCDDRFQYNFQGTSNSQIPVGTAVVSASLVSDASGAVLSTAPVPPNLQVPIASCTQTLLSFQFPLQ